MTIDREVDANHRRQSVSTGKLMNTSSDFKLHMTERLYDVKETIDNHVKQIHTSVTENVKQTIKFIQNMQKSNKNILKRPNSGIKTVNLDPSMFAIRRLWDQVESPEELWQSHSGVASNYQPVQVHPQPRQMEQIKQIDKMEYNEKAEEKKPRLTKGEEAEELMARPAKSRQNESMPRLIRNIERTVVRSMSPPPAPTAMVKLVLVDTKIQRFKRQSTDDKMVNGSL